MTGTESFEICSSHGRTSLEWCGVIPRGLSGQDDGCEFEVRLKGRNLSARVTVYDVQPHQWSKLFQDLAKDWRGWAGVRTHESLEGHLRLSCTSDRRGHIEVRVELRGDMGGSDWHAADTLYLEAGQLEHTAARAKAYFGSRDNKEQEGE